MMQEDDAVCSFTIKYKDGEFICDAGWVDFNSLVKMEVDKRMELANKVLGIVRCHYPNATNIYIEITSDDSKNIVGFVSDDIPINVIWRKWGSEHYLVYLSEIDAVTSKFIGQYPAHDAPEIDCYPYVAAIPITVIEIINDVMATATNVWHQLTNAD